MSFKVFNGSINPTQKNNITRNDLLDFFSVFFSNNKTSARFFYFICCPGARWQTPSNLNESGNLISKNAGFSRGRMQSEGKGIFWRMIKKEEKSGKKRGLLHRISMSTTSITFEQHILLHLSFFFEILLWKSFSITWWIVRGKCFGSYIDC